MNDLFKKAKGYKTISMGNKRRPLQKGELDLAVAYIMREITLRQFGHALDIRNNGSMSHRVLSVILEGAEKGDLVIQLRKCSKK